MKKLMMYKYIILTMAVGLLTACSRDNDELNPTKTDEPVPLSIVASIGEPITRAAETAWSAGDNIGVYVTQQNTTTAYTDMNGKEASNLKFTFSDGTNYETYGNTYRLFTSGTKIYLSENSVDVYGYYPYVSTTSNPEAIDIDLSDQTSQENIDFMKARKGNVNNGTSAIELLFKHRLTKLVFNLKQGEGLLPNELVDATYLGMKVKDLYYKATYNIFAEDNAAPFAINTGSGITDIIPAKAAAAPTGYVRTYEAIVLPNYTGTYPVTSNPAANRTVEITFYHRADDQIVNKFIIPSTTLFRAGYKYTFNITVNATSVTVDQQKYTEQW